MDAPRTPAALAGMVAFGLAAGCAPAFDETTFVRLRQPEAVRVEEETPGRGRSTLLAERGPPKRAELAPSEPPFTEKVVFAEVERKRSGAVELTCPSCEARPGADVVPDVGEIELHGALDDTITWSGDRLDMRWSHVALFPCYRGGGLCPREALALRLSTAQDNVRQVRHEKRLLTAHGERTGAKIAVAAGVFAVLLGSVIAVGTTVGSDRPSPIGLGVGAAFFGMGTFFLGTGIEMLRARSERTVVYDAGAGR